MESWTSELLIPEVRLSKDQLSACLTRIFVTRIISSVASFSNFFHFMHWLKKDFFEQWTCVRYYLVLCPFISNVFPPKKWYMISDQKCFVFFASCAIFSLFVCTGTEAQARDGHSHWRMIYCHHLPFLLLIGGDWAHKDQTFMSFLSP